MRDPRRRMGGEDNHDGRVLRYVQTAAVRYDSGQDQYRLSLTPAVRAAGLEANAVIRYGLDRLDALGVVPAIASEDRDADDADDTDKASPNLSYSLLSPSDDFRLEIPEAVLDALGIGDVRNGGGSDDAEAARAADRSRPAVDVYAGEGVIAFASPTTESIPVEWLPEDVDGEDGTIELRLVQTTTPRFQGSPLVASITPAFNRAGGDSAGVEYRTDIDRDGVVLAVGRADTAGANTRSVYRHGPDEQGASVSLPASVLAALDLAPEDYEDTPRSERPALAVYAGDGVLAFGHPPNREFTPT
jgi:hypothetical protein